MEKHLADGYHQPPTRYVMRCLATWRQRPHLSLGTKAQKRHGGSPRLLRVRDCPSRRRRVYGRRGTRQSPPADMEATGAALGLLEAYLAATRRTDDGRRRAVGPVRRLAGEFIHRKSSRAAATVQRGVLHLFRLLAGCQAWLCRGQPVARPDCGASARSRNATQKPTGEARGYTDAELVKLIRADNEARFGGGGYPTLSGPDPPRIADGRARR